MGFFAKTVCPECGLETERFYEGSGFGNKNAVTKCRCGYAYDNRLAVVEITSNEEMTQINPKWAKCYSDIYNVDSCITTRCPICGLNKKHDVKLRNLNDIKELTECECGYIYHNKSNMIIYIFENENESDT